jgi:hypothetical protein
MPVFDCAVVLCRMKNVLLVISNLAWLDLYLVGICRIQCRDSITKQGGSWRADGRLGLKMSTPIKIQPSSK